MKIIKFPRRVFRKYFDDERFEFDIEDFSRTESTERGKIIRNSASFSSIHRAFRFAEYYLKMNPSIRIGHVRLYKSCRNKDAITLLYSISISQIRSRAELTNPMSNSQNIRVMLRLKRLDPDYPLWLQPELAERLRPNLLKAPYSPFLMHIGHVARGAVITVPNLLLYQKNTKPCDLGDGYWWYVYYISGKSLEEERVCSFKTLVSFECSPTHQFAMFEAIKSVFDERLYLEGINEDLVIICVVIMKQLKPISKCCPHEKMSASEAVYRANFSTVGCPSYVCRSCEWRRECGICGYLLANINDICVYDRYR